MDEEKKTVGAAEMPEQTDEQELLYILPKDDENEETAQQDEQRIKDEIGARGSSESHYEKKKLPPKEALANFWYHNKVVVFVVLLIMIVGSYMIVASLPEKGDLHIGAYASESSVFSSICVELEFSFEGYMPDIDGDGKHNILMNGGSLSSTEGGATGIALNERLVSEMNGKRKYMLMMIDRELFDEIVEGCGEEIFESFEGAPLWIEITSYPKMAEWVERGECPPMGFCLLRLTDELAEKEELRKEYDSARLLLGELKAQHPDMFAPEQ